MNIKLPHLSLKPPALDTRVGISFPPGATGAPRFKPVRTSQIAASDASLEYRGPRRKKPLLAGAPPVGTTPVPISRMMPRLAAPNPRVARFTTAGKSQSLVKEFDPREEDL
jgi:hypothetical protein